MFSKILSLYDLSDPSKDALKLSFDVSSTFHSDLTIFHVMTPPTQLPGIKLDEFSRDLLRAVKERIQQDVRTLREKPGQAKPERITIDTSVDKPIVAILKKICQDSPDLVTVGTHGRSGLSHVLLGSVAERVARYSPSPVWIARSSAHWPPKKMLLPIDITESSDEALMLAAELNQRVPMQIDLVHVLSMTDLVAEFQDNFSGRVPVSQETLENAALKKLNLITSKHLRLKMIPHVFTGPIGSEICRAAKELQSDLILIPTHGRTGMAHLFLGSVVEYVTRHAPCHVLTFCPQKGLPIRKKAIEELERDSIDDLELGVGD